MAANKASVAYAERVVPGNRLYSNECFQRLAFLLFGISACAAPLSSSKSSRVLDQPFVSTVAATRVRDILSLVDPRFVRTREGKNEEAERVMARMLRVEASVSQIDDVPDIFSFKARQIAIEDAEAALAGLQTSAKDLAEARELLHEARATWKRESNLPYAGVEILEAFEGIYPASAQRDAALARRLGELEDSLEGSESFDALDAWALEDVLKDYESSSAPSVALAVTSLRLALRAFDTRAPSGNRSALLPGASYTGAERSALESVRTKLRDALPGGASEARRVTEREAAVLLRRLNDTCDRRNHASRLETFGCAVLAVDNTKGAQDLGRMLALHDLLSLALCANTVLFDRSQFRAVSARFPLWSALDEVEKERLFRKASAEPLHFLTLGRRLLNR
jgi:hypothetical protein